MCITNILYKDYMFTNFKKSLLLSRGVIGKNSRDFYHLQITISTCFEYARFNVFISQFLIVHMWKARIDIILLTFSTSYRSFSSLHFLFIQAAFLHFWQCLCLNKDNLQEMFIIISSENKPVLFICLGVQEVSISKLLFFLDSRAECVVTQT